MVSGYLFRIKRNTMAMKESSNHITLFLCGDVMTGRGIDQILPHPSNPRIHEPYVKSALRYIEIAEQVNGPIPKPVDNEYIWGDALEQFERIHPDVKIINLETAVTESNDYWPGKGINYRMSPQNIACITAARIDCCVLANNHVLDWGYAGLMETLETLHAANVNTAGAGRDIQQADAPAIMEVKGKSSVVVYAYAMDTSGVPKGWAAGKDQPGVNFLADFSENQVKEIAAKTKLTKRDGNIVVVSIHWGGNWGYEIEADQKIFAHKLIDEAGVDIIHGHSSHHVKGIEVYKDKPIFYGCGDFLNDYEGIDGYESYRGDLALMYFVAMDPVANRLVGVEMIPTRIERFRVNYAARQDIQWLEHTLNRECGKLGSAVKLENENRFILQW